MSKDEKLLSLKTLLINLIGKFQNYKKFPLQALESLYLAGIYDDNYDSILLQETLKRIEECKSVFIKIIISKEKFRIEAIPTSRKIIRALMGSIIKDNGLCVAVMYDDDENCPSTFLNERILRGEYLGTILNTAFGKKVMERCSYSNKDTENNQKDD